MGPPRPVMTTFRLERADSSGGLPVAYPGSSAQQRSQCSTRISAGADVGRGSLK